MCNRVLAAVFIILAVLLALLATLLPQDRLMSIIYISRFFDIMLPVLAVGALIKYLCSHKHCHHRHHGHDHDHDDMDRVRGTTLREDRDVANR